MPKILRYVRGEFDDQTTSYHCTATATPIERYQAHSVMGGSVEGETSGGGGRSHIGPNEIRMIIEALEGCDWVQWVKSRMKRGQALYEADEVDLDVPTERYGRPATSTRPSVADRLQLGPPVFPGDVSQRQRERYAKPAPSRPVPAARSLPTARAEEPAKERFQRVKKELAAVPRGREYFAARAGKHYEAEAADMHYRRSRKPVADAIRDFALVNGLGWDEARDILRLEEPMALLPSTP